jgi:hypothetical protein
MKATALAVSAATLTVLTFVPALAQQATGVPGSPSDRRKKLSCRLIRGTLMWQCSFCPERRDSR